MRRAKSPLLCVVLAGGFGRRLEAFVRAYDGEPVPKQFCRFGRAKSLLELTLDRVAPLGCAATAVVVDRSLADRAARDVAGRPVRLVPQPCDRGTAAGVVLPLAHLLAERPDATVLVTPSDHGYRDPSAFAETVREVRRAVDRGTAGMAVLGAAAEAPNDDYGWIVPGAPLGAGLRRVARFAEKPAPEEARELFASAALWNTMVVVARGPVLLGACRRAAPAATRAIEEAVLGGDVERAYDGLPPADFSRDVLGGAGDLAVARLPEDAGWTDLGTPERLLRWLGCDEEAAAAAAHP
jgi:mannose-1-phosphate guanylyltransferase